MCADVKLGVVNDARLQHTHRQLEFRFYSVYVNDLDVLLDTSVRDSDHDSVHLLNGKNLLTLVLTHAPGNGRSIAPQLNASLISLHSLYEKNVILFFDMSCFAENNKTHLLDSFGKVNILLNTVQIDWTKNGLNLIELEENKRLMEIEPDIPKIEFIEETDSYGFRSSSGSLIMLKSKAVNRNPVKQMFDRIKSLYF